MITCGQIWFVLETPIDKKPRSFEFKKIFLLPCVNLGCLCKIPNVLGQRKNQEKIHNLRKSGLEN